MKVPLSTTNPFTIVKTEVDMCVLHGWWTITIRLDWAKPTIIDYMCLNIS